MVIKLREPSINKLKVLIDFQDKTPYFISIETMNGRLIASGEWNIDRRRKDMYISDVTVQSKYRNKGYGSLLARIIISIAKFYKVKTVTLTDGSTLDNFWQRLGFKGDSEALHLILDLKKVK